MSVTSFKHNLHLEQYSSFDTFCPIRVPGFTRAAHWLKGYCLSSPLPKALFIHRYNLQLINDYHEI